MARRIDPVSGAALEAVRNEQNREEVCRLEQEKREKLIAQAHEIIGRIQGVNLMARFGDVAGFVWLKQVKDTGAYRGVPGIDTWEKFCDSVGISRRKVDEDLQNLEIFGEQFLATCRRFSVGYRELRKLRKEVADGAITIDSESVQIADERIPFTPDHAEDLQIAIERIIEAKDIEVRTKGRILDQKAKHIENQEKSIAELEAKVDALEEKAKAGKEPFFPPEEKDFMKKAKSWRKAVRAWLNLFDPEFNPLPDTANCRMRAELVECLGHFAREAVGVYRSAVEIYGEPDVDDSYQPPYLKVIDGKGSSAQSEE